MALKRREFLAGAGALLIAAHLRGAEEPRLRAAIIGHTGKGDYGHGLDMVFHDEPRIELVALADADEAGRAKAAARCKPMRTYADWREMIAKEKPNLVSIAPRMTGERLEMLTGVLGAGAHVICEKPFVRTPADGDEALALAHRNNLKIAVTHQMRLGPAVTFLKQKINDGLLGEIMEMHAWGKQDKRAGGEDLAVLAVHLFDLMRLFAGEPVWCSARVQENGREVTIADARPATEDIGLVLGNDIEAQFCFEKGILGTFTSRPGLRESVGFWGLELVGSKGTARILADIWPQVFVTRPGKWSAAGRTDEWKPIEGDPSATATPAQRSHVLANRRLVDDWLAAISENRDPVCSGFNAAKAVEMAHAVWRAGLSGGRLVLPLKDRAGALAGKS